MQLQYSEHEVNASDLNNLANEVCKRGLAVPAIFFLELHKPWTTVAFSAASISVPLLVPLFGPKLMRLALHLLSSRDNVEQLIRMIEIRQSEIQVRRS